MPSDAQCCVRDVEGKQGKVMQKLKTSHLFPKEKRENKDVEHGTFFLREYLVENWSDYKNAGLNDLLLSFCCSLVLKEIPVLITLHNITEIMDVLKNALN